ncbi:unnamed protein product [Phytophthora fragariaefolia]|uniref:Unnamed protein product n=1 Tax=Phytophthora fragariaefolia TaxID=1490495 RepID=A0A9W6XA28_9STRA|nr:unnamed protein product [Phytophthora fragariaefolia]
MEQLRHCELSPEWMMDTALHLYARCGRLDAARMQLLHGADTEICNAQGLTPLLLAARHNQLAVLQLLLQHGARADALAPLGVHLTRGVELGTCVHFAAESGHVQVLKFLVAAAALDPDESTRGRHGVTPLHVAARLGRADAVRYLVARGDVNVNARDARGMTPLHHACDYPNAVDGDGAARSPPQFLYDAAHVEVVDALVQAGAVPDARRTHDWATPMRCALRRGHFLVAKALADHGTSSGVAWWLHKVKTLFASAVRSRDTVDFPYVSTKRTKQQLRARRLQRESSIWDTEVSTGNDADDSWQSLARHHESALHEACKAQKLRRLRDVLKRQGCVWINARAFTANMDDCTGWTALHIAAFGGWQAGLVLLIAHGANVELTTGYNAASSGSTALHLAAQKGYSSCVLTLLDAGADINTCDELGDTPLLRALRNGHSCIVKVLLRHGAKCDYPQNLAETPRSEESASILGSFDPRRTSALHLTAFFGLISVVKEQAKSSSYFSLDAVDIDGATPLWLAVIMGHLDIVDYLANQGANLYHRVAGESTSDCAAEFGHLEILEYISASSPAHQGWKCRSLTRLALLENRLALLENSSPAHR